MQHFLTTEHICSHDTARLQRAVDSIPQKERQPVTWSVNSKVAEEKAYY